MPAFGGLRFAPLAAASEEPLPASHRANDEAAWRRIAREFLINGTHLNTGTYGASPISVINALVQHLRAFERMIGQEPVDYAALKRELEAFLHAWPGSVAILRNTTEAMNIVAAGIALNPGDEILSTTHEHIGGRCCWELLAKRHGVSYRTFAPPLDPANDDELLTAWQSAVSPRTRVLSISHVLFSTGMIQPVARLVQWARARNIITVIDGAHPPGMLVTDIQAIDADFYATSTHKWLLGPKGTGLLIVRPDRMTSTWPLIGSGDWDKPDISRFEHVGTINESLIAGLRAAIAFQNRIGRAAIEQRARSLATQLHEMLSTNPRIHIHSPRNPHLRSAMVAFTMEGTTAEALQALLGRARIRVRRVSEFGYEYVRMSTQVYVLPSQLEKAVAVLRTA